MRWTNIKWRILFFVLNNPYCTTKEAASRLELKTTTARINFRQLHTLGYIADTQGSMQSAPQWKITKKGIDTIIENNRMK